MASVVEFFQHTFQANQQDANIHAAEQRIEAYEHGQQHPEQSVGSVLANVANAALGGASVAGHIATALNPNAPAAARIGSAGQAIVKTVSHVQQHFGGGGTAQSPPQRYDTTREQIERTPVKPVKRPIDQVEGSASDDRISHDNPTEDPITDDEGEMENQPDPAQPNGSSAGGTMVGGGLRQGSSHRTRTNGIETSFTVTKSHTYIIEMDANDYTTKLDYDSSRNSVLRLKSRWYEVPDNEIAFYLDRAEVTHMLSCGRYYSIDAAGWTIRKADVMTSNERSDTPQVQANLQTQWQPTIGISRPTSCLPPWRSRTWRKPDGSSETVDNGYNVVSAVCGNAHMGSPQYLPKIEWQLNIFRGVGLDKLSADARFRNSNNTHPATDPHVDILYNCMEEYEMNHQQPIIIEKRPMRAWRTQYKMPLGVHGWNFEAFATADENSKDYGPESYLRKRANYAPGAKHISYENGYPGITTPNDNFLHAIGPDPWDYSRNYRNQSDLFAPHTGKFENPPTFICVNRLPKIQNSTYTVRIILEIDSMIRINFSTPVIFPYQPAPQGHFDQIYHGDNREVMNVNDVVSNTHTEGQDNYNRRGNLFPQF